MKEKIAKEIKIEDLSSLVQEVLGFLEVDRSSDRATVLLLEGDLGAGKTTFTKALARELGIEEIVTSPTFVLLKNYSTKNKIFKNLVHIDAYRLESKADLEVLHWSEYLENSDNLIVVEWPSQVGDLWNGKEAKLSLEVVSQDTRLAIFS